MSAPHLCIRVLFAALALAASLPCAALAQGPGVLVDRFDGPGADGLRDAVLEPIARARGLLALPPSRAEGIEGGDAQVLGALGARARIRGEVVPVGSGRVRVAVRALGASGAVVSEARFIVRRARQAERRVSVWARRDLVPALRRIGAARATSAATASAPAVMEEESEAALMAEIAAAAGAAPTDASPTPHEDVGAVAESEVPNRFSFEGGDAPPPFVFDLGVSATHRNFAYSDDLFDELTPHALPIAPYLRLALEWFPGGHFDEGLLDGLSARVTIDAALGAHSVLDNGVAHPTDGWGVSLEARYRIRFESLLLRIEVGYDAQGFGLRAADERTPRPPIPSLETHSLRAGGAARVDLGLGLFVQGAGAYLHPLAFGELGAWFPRMSGGGAEAELGMGLAIDDVELRLGVRYRRFFYSFHPEPGDERVAGGASDEYVSGSLSLIYAPPELVTR